MTGKANGATAMVLTEPLTDKQRKAVTARTNTRHRRKSWSTFYKWLKMAPGSEQVGRQR